MSTIFPSGIDLFSNPTSIKVDGIDVVRAAHMNDVQEAIKAIEHLLITPGVTFSWGGAHFISDNTPIVTGIKNLDTTLYNSIADLTQHRSYVLLTDPVQHNAEVIHVTAGGNLTSNRLQSALEELQSDIDTIMLGGTVNSLTLDNRYIGKSGAQIAQGSLTVQTNLIVSHDTTFGLTTSDTSTFNGNIVGHGSMTLDGLAITNTSLKTTQNALHIDLDTDANGTGERFFITKNNDTGNSLASPNLLLDIDQNSKLTTGVHVLKEGVQETGYFGNQFFSPDPGNVFNGFGVNFKQELANIPASITLTLLNNTNAQSVSVTNITKYGFFVQFASVAGGNSRIYGTYTTVGN